MRTAKSWTVFRPLIALILAAMVILPGAASVAAQDAQTATVGVAFTLTGNAAVYGQSQLKGAELAAEEINANGVIPGVTLKLDIQDDGGAPETGVPVFQSFVNDSNVVAIIGPTLSNVAKTTDP